MVAAPILGKHAAEAGSVRRRHVAHGVLAVEKLREVAAPIAHWSPAAVVVEVSR